MITKYDKQNFQSVSINNTEKLYFVGYYPYNNL